VDEPTIFLAGDVMTGRGVDQILPHSGDPVLFEPAVIDARDYVALAEQVHGAVPAPAPFEYPWGEALEEIDEMAPEARIVNLETSVTAAAEPWPGKGIHYRMHPGNLPCLTAAKLDCCVLANNHVADWGLVGLRETLAVVHGAGIATAGAGADLEEAAAPAVLPLAGGGRLLVVAGGFLDSGIPGPWRAEAGRPGVHLLSAPASRALPEIARCLDPARRPGDLVVVSLHWGGNWGFEIPAWHRELAHRLIDELGVAVVHGHSSHHVKGIEVYNGRLVLYGCGDLLTDYEGIGGYGQYRGDLGLLYFATLERSSGKLLRLRMTPTCMERLRLRRSPADGARWLLETLNRWGGSLGTRLEPTEGGRLELRWEG
jgi:poly-gamma-glutamate capsule biosynthesis protein CapA/YwtB (metallophosphatase superfamily)